jgi:biopolymer transport protein ExbD
MSKCHEATPVINQTVLNVRNDGAVIWNRQEVSRQDLGAKLKRLAELSPDYAIILRGDRDAPYKYIVSVLDICRAANIWNVAFATDKVE